LVDFVDGGGANGDIGGARVAERGPSGDAFGSVEFFRIVEQRGQVLWHASGKDHGGGDHGAGQRAAANFVYPGHAPASAFF
jgi:hypothetical protein